MCWGDIWIPSPLCVSVVQRERLWVAYTVGPAARGQRAAPSETRGITAGRLGRRLESPFAPTCHCLENFSVEHQRTLNTEALADKMEGLYEQYSMFNKVRVQV